MPHPSLCQSLMYLSRALWYKYISVMLIMMPTVRAPLPQGECFLCKCWGREPYLRGREWVLIPEFLMLQVCRNKQRQHQQQQQQQKKSPSENLSLIAPICSGAASPHCLPGCLPQTLSSTLFSISCNHLLEIYFSFKMSPGNQNQHLEEACSG